MWWVPYVFKSLVGPLATQVSRFVNFWGGHDGLQRRLECSKLPRVGYCAIMDGFERHASPFPHSWWWKSMKEKIGRPLAQCTHVSSIHWGSTVVHFVDTLLWLGYMGTHGVILPFIGALSDFT